MALCVEGLSEDGEDGDDKLLDMAEIKKKTVWFYQWIVKLKQTANK